MFRHWSRCKNQKTENHRSNIPYPYTFSRYQCQTCVTVTARRTPRTPHTASRASAGPVAPAAVSAGPLAAPAAVAAFVVDKGAAEAASAAFPPPRFRCRFSTTKSPRFRHRFRRNHRVSTALLYHHLFYRHLFPATFLLPVSTTTLQQLFQYEKIIY